MYDIAIIGQGPAGLTSAIYALRAGLKTICFEKGLDGGQVFNASAIENYPGGIIGETGADFATRMASQADKFGREKINAEIIEIKRNHDFEFLIKTTSSEYSAKTVVIATGTSHKTLGLKNEIDYIGKGLSFCATCDGPLFKCEEVVVVGGGDSAFEESLFLSKICSQVNLVHRRDEFRATDILIKKVLKQHNINIITDSVVEEVIADEMINQIIIKNIKNNETTQITRKDGTKLGLFVFVGLTPNVELVKTLDVKTEGGYILTDQSLKTNIKGLFAIGDVRNKPLRQVVTAVADGANVVTTILKELDYA